MAVTFFVTHTQSTLHSILQVEEAMQRNPGRAKMLWRPLTEHTKLCTIMNKN